MNKILKFFKRRTWLVILLSCLLFVPQSFSYQAKLNMRVVVTGIAIDKAESAYEVTAQVVVPLPGAESGNSNAQVDFISEKGSSVAEGIQKLSYKIGKEAGLSHTDFIIMGSSMQNENLISVLDFFVRDDQVSPALMLFFCEGSAKETIKETKDLELSVGVGLRKVFINKENSLSGIFTPVNDFVNYSFGVSKTSFISGLNIAGEEEGKTQSSPEESSSNFALLEEESQKSSNEEKPSEQSSSGGESESKSSDGGQSGGQSSNGGQVGSARIQFYNDIHYFKDGVYVGKLDSEQEILGMFFYLNKSRNGKFKISNISGDILEDAVASIQFSSKKTFKKVEFKDGKPILKIKVEFGSIRLQELLNKSSPTLNIYSGHEKELSEVVIRSIKEQIRQCIISAFTKAQNDNADIFRIGDMAYETKPKQWKEFYKKEGDNFLASCDVEVEVKIKNFV